MPRPVAAGIAGSRAWLAMERRYELGELEGLLERAERRIEAAEMGVAWRTRLTWRW